MKEVFAAHPKAKKIWVVKNMPFLDEKQATNYALSQKAEVEEVERPVEEEETEFEKVFSTEGVGDSGDKSITIAKVEEAVNSYMATHPPAPPANDPPAPPANDPPAIKAKGK